MLWSLPRISNSSCPLSKALYTVLSAPTTISITVTLLFHNLLCFQTRPKKLSILSLSLIFNLVSTRKQNSLNGKLFFLLIKTMSGLLVRNRGSVHIIKSQKILCASFSRMHSAFAHTTFGSMVKFQFLAQFPVDHHPHQVVSSLVLYSFYASLPYLLTTRLIVLSYWPPQPTLSLLLWLLLLLLLLFLARFSH